MDTQPPDETASDSPTVTVTWGEIDRVLAKLGASPQQRQEDEVSFQLGLPPQNLWQLAHAKRELLDESDRAIVGAVLALTVASHEQLHTPGERPALMREAHSLLVRARQLHRAPRGHDASAGRPREHRARPRGRRQRAASTGRAPPGDPSSDDEGEPPLAGRFLRCVSAAAHPA